MRGYTRLVRATTGRWYTRYATLLAAIAFLVGSVCLLAQVPGSFLPPEDASRIVLSVELPPNATLDDTEHDDRCDLRQGQGHRRRRKRLRSRRRLAEGRPRTAPRDHHAHRSTSSTTRW